MSERQFVTVDGNDAATHVAHQVSEVIAIYPITPASPMGELADAWSSVGRTNIWGAVPDVIEMQSEGGAAAAVHGAIQAGALTTTFTASQGLLLMIPTMFKIAGELTPTVFHISARTLATHALSIFGDHSDVMSVRSTGWAMLVSNSVQEVQDMAMIAHAATLKARVPFLHFFDGFRTSHEVNKIEQLTADDIRAMIDEDLVRAHRMRAMNPDRPVLRGTAQNPDVFFQAREACNPFYVAIPRIVQETMDRFAQAGRPAVPPLRLLRRSGRHPRGRASWDRVPVPPKRRSTELNRRGEKVGMVKVRLFRPVPDEAFLAALPKTIQSIAVLDRTKEPGAIGEPLYQDVVTALMEGWHAASGNGSMPNVIGGRYGLSSKEFTPAMAARVFEELAKDQPKTAVHGGHHRRRDAPESEVGPGVHDGDRAT